MKILVWLSWGVDSAVSAYLLREAGHEVACGFMINYLDEEHPESCPTLADLEEAKRVATFLSLPLYTFDYRDEYEKRIVAYIYSEYEAGRTPNPDVFCNNLVKFDLFLEEAISLGYDMVATGHYARIGARHCEEWNDAAIQALQDETWIASQARNDGNIVLLKWTDPNKDQSYFLSRLSKEQLEKAIFPIGHLLKSEVREIARKTSLPNAERKDSQWLCFIGKVSMKEFLERRIEKKKGNILDRDGQVIGEHEGAYSYTIGQRKGIKVGGWSALFVVAKDVKNNTITVWDESALSLYSTNCTLTGWFWDTPEIGREYGAKIRYRQEDQPCKISGNEVHFTSPQRAITPGQIAVIYDHDRVVGSGIIV